MTRAATGNERRFLEALFRHAVAAAQPDRIVPRYLPRPPEGRTIVVGAGKASAQMARAFERSWPGELEGTVVTQYGAGVPCQTIEVLEASHPVPDEAGLRASTRLMELARAAGPDDLVVALVSGGGSSLLPLPAPGLSLADEQAVNRALLASGAPISAMNVVRKAISGIKGGRLAAAAWPAPVISLILSDVPGDDPAAVASGPSVADANGLDEARAIIARHGLNLPPAVTGLIASGAHKPLMPGDPHLALARHRIIGSAAQSLGAAAAMARAEGFEVRLLSDAIEGEAKTVGAAHGEMIVAEAENRRRARPLLILSGGETSVTFGGNASGKGGRNAEYALALALGIAGLENVTVLAADTDGRDGSEDNAGAFVDGGTVSRLAAAGIDAARLLARHDAWTGFEAIGDLLVTGPTGTNVNDFRAALVV